MYIVELYLISPVSVSIMFPLYKTISLPASALTLAAMIKNNDIMNLYFINGGLRRLKLTFP